MDLAAWMRTPLSARIVDAVLVVSAFGVGIGGHWAKSGGAKIDAAPLSLGIVLCAAGAAITLLWRRRRPVLVPVVCVLWMIVAAAFAEPGLFGGEVVVLAVVTTFGLGAWTDMNRRLVVAISVVTLLVVLGGSAGSGSPLSAVTLALALIVTPAIVGVATRTRRRYLDEVEQRLAVAERERDERATQAVRAERARIARELHDVVAHHVSLIGVQAGAARTAMDRSPQRAIAALESIESSSRDAVREMRQLLDVLRPLTDESSGPLLQPQPGLHAIDELIQRMDAAGYRVDATIELSGADVSPPGSPRSLAAYRIVEEALTNVTRHSHARSIELSVVDQGSVLRIAVRDPGPARSAPSPHGRGLIGMAERAAVFNGELRAGPLPDGSFAVAAVLPEPV